ncbi:unnamed protein product [Mytilus edulis]|uniref:Transposase Tc1-like domain-containing protein n=1 Tax=Mytilus edulis TaxID=6550 RepID=A0A8S3RE69_MYTED|nr:unnamed protein product [Mytilus edulis]
MLIGISLSILRQLGTVTAPFKKSFCNSQGQETYDNGDTRSDTKCICNTHIGYTYVMNTKDQCYCSPLTEDCSCYFGINPYNETIGPKDIKCYDDTKRTRSPDYVDRLEIASLYRQNWKISAIVRYLSNQHGIDVNWSTVRNVILKYKSGDLFADPNSNFIKFHKVTDGDISTVRSALAEQCTMTATDVRRELVSKGSVLSKTTVQRIIHEAGYTASAPRYCQMIREANKVKRLTFCQQLITDNDNFADIIFTDECTVQLHDNKVVIYRLRDQVAQPIPQPKHPFKLHVWGGISRRGTTRLLNFDRLFKTCTLTNTVSNKTMIQNIVLYCQKTL